MTRHDDWQHRDPRHQGLNRHHHRAQGPAVVTSAVRIVSRKVNIVVSIISKESTDAAKIIINSGLKRQDRRRSSGRTSPSRTPVQQRLVSYETTTGGPIPTINITVNNEVIIAIIRMNVNSSMTTRTITAADLVKSSPNLQHHPRNQLHHQSVGEQQVEERRFGVSAGEGGGPCSRYPEGSLFGRSTRTKVPLLGAPKGRRDRRRIDRVDEGSWRV
ncbi:hypothetical protein BDK51DRAFT_27667 [Blyttiomyces helicus]|uniref:Uncharacterized protein n=1 Tax=Blyttiomyces helicus TaxID=388810 RepID=A0A4P9WIN1_9FUNG|nr:hypothetical protein BDK51DRAFT_27667 [Blyttiomyces helicus]|eukprot:RKO90990.1 hypothetical protein BDK51DRAFT_27667 [Blyttiomyces helicus]